MRERILRAAANQRPVNGELLIDPIEHEPGLSAVLMLAETQAESTIDAQAAGRMGYCHLLWASKAEILMSRFGITWFNSAQMNPGVFMD